MRIGGHEIEISNREKLFFPNAGLTKGDVMDYYAQVAETMVPHMKRYGVSMQRFPDGLKGKGFYSKDAPAHFPGWIRTVRIPKGRAAASMRLLWTARPPWSIWPIRPCSRPISIWRAPMIWSIPIK